LWDSRFFLILSSRIIRFKYTDTAILCVQANVTYLYSETEAMIGERAVDAYSWRQHEYIIDDNSIEIISLLFHNFSHYRE